MRKKRVSTDKEPIGYRNEFQGPMGPYTEYYATKALANKDARRRKDPRLACVEVYEGQGLEKEVTG